MPKLDHLQQKKLNPADELRTALGSLEERRLAVKKMDSAQALALLRDLDRLQALFEQLEAAGLDLLAERGRFDTVQAGLKKSTGPLLRAAGGPAALRRARPPAASAGAPWWWHLDARVARQQQRLRKQLFIGLAVVLAVVGGVVLAFKTVLAPSPEVIARLEAENAAYLALEAGDLPAALTAIETGLQAVPAEPNLLLFMGVLHAEMGQQVAAEDAYVQAQAGFADKVSFYIARSQLQMRVGRPNLAERDARQALQIDETSPVAWLLVGQSLEVQGNPAEAMAAYQKAGDLAFEQGNNEVVVMARLAMGRLGMGGGGL
jgi:Tfp pilus assembly protein PilF